MRRRFGVQHRRQWVVAIAGVLLALATIIGCQDSDMSTAQPPANVVRPTSTAGAIVEASGSAIQVRDRTGRQWHVSIDHDTQIVPEGAVLANGQSAVVVGPPSAGDTIDATYVRVLFVEGPSPLANGAVWGTTLASADRP